MNKKDEEMKLFIRPKMQKPNTYRVPPRELQEGKEKKCKVRKQNA